MSSARVKKIIRSDLIKDKWPRKLQFKSQTGGSQNGNVPFREASSRRLSPTPCQYINSGKRRRTVCSEKWLPWLLPWHLDRDLITSQWMILNYTATIHLNHCYIFGLDSKCPKMFPPNILCLCLFVTLLSLGLGNQVCEKWNLNKNDPICRFLFKWSVCTYR